MPRKRNPIGIAAGKMILAIRNEQHASAEQADKVLTDLVLHRAHVLLQASESSSVLMLLDGRSVVEYLDAGWIEAHPSVKPSVDALILALSTHERT